MIGCAWEGLVKGRGRCAWWVYRGGGVARWVVCDGRSSEGASRGRGGGAASGSQWQRQGGVRRSMTSLRRPLAVTNQ